MNILNWLQKPYPLIEEPKEKLILALSFGIFVFLFLLIFKPFGADEIIKNQSLFLAGFGLCVFIGLLINYMIIPFFFPSIFCLEKWKIKKEIIYLISSFVVIALLNYTYNTVVGKNIAIYKSLSEFLGITISIGLLPVVILTFIIERNLTKKNTLKAEELSKSLLKPTEIKTSETSIAIESESLKVDSLKMNLNDFVFATSDNNYTTVFYLKDDTLNRKLLRLSIKNLEHQLSGFQNIIRCHRSYIVNKQMIKRIKGNARSLVLLVNYYDEAIPVSRSFPKEKLV